RSLQCNLLTITFTWPSRHSASRKIGATSLLPPQFKRDTTRFTLDASADAAIVMTVPHMQEPGGVDVWKWNVQHREAAPVLLAYLRDLRWQDAAPSLLR